MGHLARRTVTVEEAAAMLGIGRSTAFDLVTSGQLQSFTIGRRRLVVVSGIDEFVRRRLAESA
jgi:excisionase family DNA binding protein